MLEVCVASLDDAIAAAAAGADRLELSTALEVGGLTPSLELVAAVQAAVALPIIVLVRPRAGDFCFSHREQAAMLRDIATVLDCGVAGVACGSLTAEGAIDRQFWRRVVDLAKRTDVVFHRAFDAVDDPLASLETLIELETTRVLTSGGAATALSGASPLASLVRHAGERIEILPAGGIDAAHIAQLLAATGCRQVHGSFRDFAPGPLRLSAARVAAARAALDACQSPSC